MKILFVAPRCPTNQVEIIKILLQKNHDVFFHVASKCDLKPCNMQGKYFQVLLSM
jgi:hypothetical protein